jgi:hypothetical protein
MKEVCGRREARGTTMNFLTLALKYFPYVLRSVKVTEATIGDAKGQDKKAVVLAVIQAAAELGEQVPEEHVRVISMLIDKIVGSLNGSGVFKS